MGLSSSGTGIILALIAGLSTMIGAAFVVLSGKLNDKILAVAMGFASGVLLSACFLDLFPEAEEYFSASFSDKGAVAVSIGFMTLGLILAYFSEHFLPHTCGHDHNDHDHTSEEDISRIGLISMIAIGLHNFPEGIALYVAGRADTAMGISLCVAVILHNIPGGITIAAPVYYSSKSRVKALLYTLIPSLIQPFGAVLAWLVLGSIISGFVMGIMFSLVAGFLLFTALVELYPASRQYGHHNLTAMATFAGILVMPLTHLIS